MNSKEITIAFYFIVLGIFVAKVLFDERDFFWICLSTFICFLSGGYMTFCIMGWLGCIKK